MKNIVQIYLLIIVLMSLISIIITIYDKLAAKGRKQRIPENTLLLTGAMGGASAMFFTMLIIRHKTRHIKFMLFLPIMSVLHIALTVYLCFNIS